MNKKSLLALTLGVSVAVGSLVMGTYTMVQANHRPAGIEQEAGRHERPERPEGPRMNKEEKKELLTLLQIDEETFKQEKAKGKSLAEIGAEHNVPRQEIVDLILKHMNQHLDEMKKHAPERVEDMVDGKHMGWNKMPMNGKECPRPAMPSREDRQELLNLLHMDEPTFKEEMKSGKTLGEIADGHQVSRQAMTDLLVKHMNQHIDQQVKDGRFTEEQGNEMKSHAVERAEHMLDRHMMEHHRPHEKVSN